MPYFDGCYFDGAYFDASVCAPASSGGRPSLRRLPDIEEILTYLEDEDMLTALEGL